MGALAGGGLSDHLGRKTAIILGASLVALGALIHTSAVYLWLVVYLEKYVAQWEQGQPVVCSFSKEHEV